jgi:TPR repeat protein
MPIAGARALRRSRLYQPPTVRKVDAAAATQEVRQLQRAADLGEAQAQHGLALCHLRGDGVAKDLAESVRLFLLAAAQGHAPAQSSLGLCYAVGQGVPVNYGESARWYRLAAEQGDTTAQNSLALLYLDGNA